MIERLVAFFAVLLLICTSAPAAAHSSPNSQVTLDLSPGAIEAEIIIPQSDYAAATGNGLLNRPAMIAAARDYLEGRLAIRAPDDRNWQGDYQLIEFVQVSGPPYLRAVARFTPPPGASDRNFQLVSDMVFDRLPDHFTLVRIGNDLAGRIGSGRAVAGMLTAARPDLAIERGEASSWNAFANSFLLGAHHIAIGYDHLLFLLALLLPAPFVARAGRWSDRRPHRATIVLLASIVTGFTLGHSLTLALATLFELRLPQAPVEALIALSVFVSAIHALRPLFPRRESLVAFLFGTVHGLAFATLIGGYAVGKASRGVSLLGFNLGIEAIQLAIVAASLPILLVASRWPIYRALRIAAGAFAALAAAAWLAQRVFGIGDALAGMVEAILPGLGIDLALLSLGALVYHLTRRNAQTGLSWRG